MKQKFRWIGFVLVSILVCAFFASPVAAAATGEITNARYKTDDVQTCAIFDAVVTGAQSHKIHFSNYVYSAYDDNPIENASGDPEYSTVSDYLVSTTDDSPKYSSTQYTDVKLCIPLREFPLSHEDYDYYFYVEVYDDTSSALLASYQYNDTLTDPGDGNQSIRISYVTLNANASSGSKKGVSVTFAVNTLGYENYSSLDVYLYIKDQYDDFVVAQKGVVNKQYTALDGTVGVGTTIRPNGNEYAVWKNDKRITLFFPDSVLPPPPSGGYTIYPYIEVDYNGSFEYSIDMFGVDEYSVNVT